MYKIKLVDFCSNLRYNDLYRERSHKARYMSLRQINLIFLKYKLLYQNFLYLL